MIASSAHETVGKFRFSNEIPQLRPFYAQRCRMISLETDSVVDATLMWCPELTLKQSAAVGTRDERTVFGDSPSVPHQDLSHLRNGAHLVD